MPLINYPVTDLLHLGDTLEGIVNQAVEALDKAAVSETIRKIENAKVNKTAKVA